MDKHVAPRRKTERPLPPRVDFKGPMRTSGVRRGCCYFMRTVTVLVVVLRVRKPFWNSLSLPPVTAYSSFTG